MCRSSFQCGHGGRRGSDKVAGCLTTTLRCWFFVHVGTGKTATLWEVGHILRARGVPRALIDTDELDRVWPTPETTEALISISRRNLRAVWETFASHEIRYLVLCGVMASVAQSRAWIEDAIP